LDLSGLFGLSKVSKDLKKELVVFLMLDRGVQCSKKSGSKKSGSKKSGSMRSNVLIWNIYRHCQEWIEWGSRWKGG
jgi:hypothetical protein